MLGLADHAEADSTLVDLRSAEPSLDEISARYPLPTTKGLELRYALLDGEVWVHKRDGGRAHSIAQQGQADPAQSLLEGIGQAREHALGRLEAFPASDSIGRHDGR